MRSIESKNGSWRQVARRAATVGSTAATGALAVGLVVVGAGFIESRATNVTPVEAAPPVDVESLRLSLADGYQVPRSFVGQVEPLQRTDVAFDLSGTVEAVTVDEGQSVKRGQILARLDTRTLQNQKAALLASRQAFEAQAELARLTAERKEALKENGFSTTQSFDEARLRLAELEARLAETDAAVAGIDIQLDKAIVRAPFDGQVGARFADEGAWVGGGTPILTLLQNGTPQMRVGIAPSIAGAVKPGDRLTVEIGGRSFDAALVQLRSDLDRITRTQTALLAIQATVGEAAPLFGQTGTLQLTEKISEAGAWIPVTALREGKRGLWTVLTVLPGDQPDEGIVAFEAVEVLYSDQDRAFVRGTFRDGASIVAAGLHRVTPGQRVRIEDKS
ncbi:MAG: efflux RND transporter periplasmic adaptor subunit [Hyphomicrobiales bacterium]|nr:efflux RND transporter periplasmic adaptor subunit [Hyphomicrobiales bacterium]